MFDTNGYFYVHWTVNEDVSPFVIILLTFYHLCLIQYQVHVECATRQSVLFTSFSIFIMNVSYILIDDVDTKHLTSSLVWLQVMLAKVPWYNYLKRSCKTKTGFICTAAAAAMQLHFVEGK